MDAYNANPLSMSEAISSFADLVTDKNKILVLGEMREMGVDEMAEHKKSSNWYSDFHGLWFA